MNNPHEFGFFRLLVRNIANRPHRNIATIISFAIIAATLFSAQILLSGAEQSLDNGMTKMGADIMVVPSAYNAKAETVILMGQPSTFFFSDSGFEKISKITGVAKASPQIFISYPVRSGMLLRSCPVHCHGSLK